MDLTPKQACLLRHMGPFAAYTPSQLGDMTGTSPEGVVRTAASLVRRGLIERERLGGRVRYELTGEGRAAAKYLQAAGVASR